MAILVMGGLGIFFSAGLAVADKKLKSGIDKRIKEIEDLLPNVQCGACAYPGCGGFAEALVRDEAEVNQCRVADNEVKEKISRILGIEFKEKMPQVAIMRCQGGKNECRDRAVYVGIEDCRTAQLVDGGGKECSYGCLGLDTCARACPFNAIVMDENGLPQVSEDKCTGCGICVEICPRNIPQLVDRTTKMYLACLNNDKGKKAKDICSRGCFTCMLCASNKITPSGSIKIIDNLPQIDWERDQGDWKNALDKCPAKCFVERKIALRLPFDKLRVAQGRQG